MLIAMAGLPGTGKSTLATRLAAALNGVILSKDIVRSALFPPPVLDYSSAQNDIAMQAIFTATAYIHARFPDRPILIDGRTFLKLNQLRDLFALGQTLCDPPRIIECTCADEFVRERLERDLTAGVHPARNRTFELYMSGKARAQPITVPHLTLDTGILSIDECLQKCLAYLSD